MKDLTIQQKEPKDGLKMADFENYGGNLRIESIDFDGLMEMFRGQEDEYNPKVEREGAKPYVGKVGKYEKYSYVYNPIINAILIEVRFENGERIAVFERDVSFTEEPCTSQDYLPYPAQDLDGYRKLTEEEKDFSDKVFLQLVSNNNVLKSDNNLLRDLQFLSNQATQISMYRSDKNKKLWFCYDLDEE